MSKQNREQNRTERAAAIRLEQTRKERTKRVLIVAGVVAVLAVIVAAGVWYSSGGSDTASASSKTPKAVVGTNSLVVGNNRDAKVKVVVYEDFLCPFCRQFETSSRDFLHTDAAEGKVLVEYRPFQLLQDGYSTRALNAWSSVLENGTPAQALKYHDALYDNQPYENDANKPDNADLKKLAKKVGIDDSKVLDGFDTENTTFYAAVEKAAQSAHVTGTPTVVVNGKQLTGSSVDAMVSTLEKQIAAS